MARYLDAAELQAVLNRVPGIQSCRVVVDDGGRISEVHVLANLERAPKQIVRDVQSALMASFDVRVDHRVVSVVQLESAAEAPVSPGTSSDVTPKPGQELGGRAAIRSVSMRSEGASSEVTVDLTFGGEIQAGAAKGPATAGLRLVAEASVEALRPTAGVSSIQVLGAGLCPVQGTQIAVVILQVERPAGGVQVVGSALVRRDVNDAVARATLAAMNRLLAV